MAKAASSPGPVLTKHQALVLDALRREAQPASAYGLLEQLREQGLRAPQQVYRALDKLLEYGLIHRVESLNAFVACAHPEAHQHGLAVFAICDRCGQADEFSDEAIAHSLQQRAQGQAFRMATATVEMHGICERCSAAQPEEAAPEA